MRAVSEQPRVAIAKGLVGLCLIIVGVAIGDVLRNDGRDDASATEARLVSAHRNVRDQRAELDATRSGLDRTIAKLARARRALRIERRANQRLRRELRSTRRALDRSMRRE